MMNEHEIKNRLNTFFQDVALDENVKQSLIQGITLSMKDLAAHDNLRNRLQILFEYEKHCLDTIKEYKEEIKFAASLQEDLRRERSQFFTQTLKEVSNTLKQAEVDQQTISEWIKELVGSYTQSLNLSGDLAESHVTGMMNTIKEEQKSKIEKVNVSEREG